MFLIEQTDAQAKAIRALLDGKYDGVGSSWNKEYTGFDARPYINEWHNGRENGYVIHLNNYAAGKHLVIVFFEYRNSDDICLLVWESDEGFLNPPTLEDIPDGVFMKRHDVTKRFNYGQIGEAVDFIYEQMESFWKKYTVEEKSNDAG